MIQSTNYIHMNHCIQRRDWLGDKCLHHDGGGVLGTACGWGYAGLGFLPLNEGGEMHHQGRDEGRYEGRDRWLCYG